VFVETAKGRFVPRKYHVPPAITMIATNPRGEWRQDRAPFRLRGLRLRRRGFRRGGYADLQRIDPDRLGDILEFGGAEIAHSEIQP
jgi:hypothetical protein